jgi:hypothetical protein
MTPTNHFGDLQLVRVFRTCAGDLGEVAMQVPDGVTPSL